MASINSPGSSRVPTASPRRYERHRSANKVNRKQDPLLMCVELNYTDELENILKTNGKHYTQDKLDQAFLRAAETGKTEACKLLVTAGSDPNARESPVEHNSRYSRSNHPFIPEHGKQETWSKCHTSVGGTALHLAVENSHMRTVQMLIHLGTNVNGYDRNGVTPLMLACMKRGTGNIAHLLTLIPGNDLSLKDNLTKKTALHYAAEIGDATIVKILLESGAQVEDTDSEGNTALMLALSPPAYENPKWPQRQTEQCVQLLLQNGSYVNTYNRENRTPIDFAVVAGLPEAVEYLLERSAIVSKDVLRKACLQIKDERVVELLLNKAHTFEDEFLCVLLLLVIASVTSKWDFNSRDEEYVVHQIAQSIVKAVSSPLVYTSLRSLTDQQLGSALGEDILRAIPYSDLLELRTYGIFGYALLRGKYSIARLLYEAGCRDRLSMLRDKTEVCEMANKHTYLKNWLPLAIQSSSDESDGSVKDKDEVDSIDAYMASLDLEKAFDKVEPYDNAIHQSGHGMLDVNYISREKSRAYLATNVLIYSN